MTRYDHGRFSEFAVADNPSLPERFQNYSIDKNMIGEGPISLCYLARRADTGAPVRLKVLRRRLCKDPEIAELFQTHGRLLSEFRGSQIQKYLGLVTHDGNLLLEYEYIEGETLRAIIEESAPLHPDLVALIGRGIVHALNQVHGLRPSPGMGNLIPLHRNLKPENVIVSLKGQILLTDIDMLPICRQSERNKIALPYSLEVYESPEQLLKNGYADRRSDIFALGLILLEMATGRYPYGGSNAFEVRQNIRENYREDPGSLFPKYHDRSTQSLSKGLSRIIGSMVEPNPEKRTQSLLDIEGQFDGYFKGAAYDYPEKALTDFLKLKSFQPERAKKKNFIDKLFGG